MKVYSLSLKDQTKKITKKGKVKGKQILIRVSDNLSEAIEKAIDAGIADNASEFVRRCIVNQLLDMEFLEIPKFKKKSED